MMQMTGADLIVKLLERQGISTIAGVPGGAALPMYDALSKSEQIHHVLCRHEQGAGFIAQGMARVSGRPEVCLASSGPGATNLITAIADAKLDSIPIIALTGQVPLSMIGTDAFQEVDTYGLTIPITKHNFLVRSAKDLLDRHPGGLPHRHVRSPRPGADRRAEGRAEPDGELRGLPRRGGARCGAQLRHRRHRRGREDDRGRRAPGALPGRWRDPLRRRPMAVTLAEQASLPTTMTLMALGAMPMDHPLSIGMLGMHGARYTNYVLEEADLLICVGARFDDRAIGKTAEFCPNAKIIHIDIDRSELHKVKNAHVAIAGDVGRCSRAAAARQAAAAQALAVPRGEPQGPLPAGHAGHRQPALALRPDPRRGQLPRRQRHHHQRRRPAPDVGGPGLPVPPSRQWLNSGGLGTMGFGFPAAIGAALAAPDRTVVCFSGDGSLKMNIQEMATAAQENVNVKILMNNQSLGLVHQQQNLFYGKRIMASRYERPTDFLKIAEGFGMRAVDLDPSPNPRATLAEALHTPGPCLIHATIDPNEFVYPMVPPGAANSEMIG
jgi:acetolactate synthase-1/2/3 large subunit